MNAQTRFNTNNIKAVMFGAIGVIAETSKLQFDAFNQAFKDAGLGWHWTRDAYLEMLTDPGGINRIEKYATTIGHQLEVGQAERVYNKKSQIFEELLASTDLQPRPGVAALIEQCKANSVKGRLGHDDDGTKHRRDENRIVVEAIFRRLRIHSV